MSLEQRLWDAADVLRGNQEPSEYKRVVRGLIFLKYISDRFGERRRAIEIALSDPDSDDDVRNEARRVQFIEDRDKYASHNVFWVPTDARWQAIQDSAKPPSSGQDIAPPCTPRSDAARQVRLSAPITKRRRSSWYCSRQSSWRPVPRTAWSDQS